MTEKPVAVPKKEKEPIKQQNCIYRTTPYQFDATAPFENHTETVGKILVFEGTTVIKSITVSTKQEE